MVNELKVFSAAVMVSAAAAAAATAPVMAQAVIQAPGSYAFYHPGADLSNAAPWPQNSANVMTSVRTKDQTAATDVQPTRRRSAEIQK
jgi:hypothetical protein